MSILDIARADLKKISDDVTQFSVSIIIVPDTGDFNAPAYSPIVGQHTKHHLGVNGETGQRVNTKTASISFTEHQLTDQSYPVRGTDGEVFLRDHKVRVKDSTGTSCDYVIREWFPDETLGLIVCILGDFE